MEQIPLGCLNEESVTRLTENFSHGFPWGGEGMVVGGHLGMQAVFSQMQLSSGVKTSVVK